MMSTANRVTYLRVVLVVVGVVALCLYPLTIVWPAGWTWHHTGQSPYMQMIIGIYGTLGICLIVASRNPLANRSLIWFTVWSSFVHGGIMAVQAFIYPGQLGHLLGDVPILFVAAAALALLMPRDAAASG